MANTPNITPTTDFTQVDFTTPNPASITSDPTYTAIDNATSYQKAGAATTNKTGQWVVNGKSFTAGQITLAKLWSGYLTTNSTIATQLSSMNINTQFANASAQFSASIKAAASSMSTTDSKTYADLVSLAAPFAQQVGMTATQFVQAVLPNEPATNTYTQTTLQTLATTVDQYSNSKLTDNSVLQAKMDTATANRNSLITAMTGLQKSWNDLLTNLGKAL